MVNGEGDCGFIVNVDTKWKTHANFLEVEKKDWRDHEKKNLNDLYCLAICKQRGIKTLRDLRGEHLPLLRGILEKGKEAIKETYGVDGDQLRVLVHYMPQFNHLNVHFTRLWNDKCTPEKRICWRTLSKI